MSDRPAILNSRIYRATVTHKRLHPFVHRFRYAVVSLLIDLDELPALDRSSLMFGYNRWRPMSFFDSDHGPKNGGALRPWIDAELAMAGIDLDGGRVMLLCFPRLFGYVFNPLSVWCCHRRDGSLAAILYEVRNTFGQHHSYLIPVEPAARGVLRQSCDKGFYVSPFLPMDCRYRFRMAPPQERLSIAIRLFSGEREMLVATLTGEGQPWSAGGVLNRVLRQPLATLKVMAAIHWQALHLWRKGGRFHRRPATPHKTVTVIANPAGPPAE